MSNKLTKNDSINVKKSISDLKSKNVQIDLDVLVAAFEAFLKKQNAHASYFREWEKAKEYSGTANVFYAWREWAKQTTARSWINNAFVWHSSKDGYFYWREMNREWYVLYCQNLKK